ncbi:MAG: hypothetical protein QGD94_07970, partial [Planctomycetia bacterium]|nr:hypothetical protein [Planctomycetia bacterium]
MYWEMARNDLVFFVAAFLETFRPQDYGGRRVVPFVPWPMQIPKILLASQEAIREGHDLVIPKPREVGVTEGVIAVFVHEFIFVPESTFGISSKKESDVYDPLDPSSHFSRIERFLSKLPTWMKPPVKKRGMTWSNQKNGSSIVGETTTINMFRQKRFTGVFLDEFAVVEGGVDIVGHTGAIARCRIFGSTQQLGINGFSRALKGESGEPVGRVVQIFWWEHPEKVRGLYYLDEGKPIILDESYVFPDDFNYYTYGTYRSPAYNEAERRAGSYKFVQREWDGIVHASGDMFFDIPRLTTHKAKYCLPPLHRGKLNYRMEYGRENAKPRFTYWTEGASNRALLLWTPLTGGKPIRTRRYVIGCDISFGTGASNSVMAIYDVNEKDFVGEFANPDVGPEEFARIVVTTAQWFGGMLGGRVYLIWDGPGAGQLFGRKVQEYGYSYFYRHRGQSDIHAKKTKTPGWFGHKAELITLYGQLRAAIGDHEVKIHSAETLNDLYHYIVGADGGVVLESLSDTSTGARAAHGDRGVAYALCIEGANYVRPLRPDLAEPEPWSSAWFLRQEEAERKKLE